MRNAISRSRSMRVCARNSVSSKIVASGQNEIVVPCFFDAAVLVSLSWGLPPLAKCCSHLPPSRWISTSRRLDSALTTDAPTPWRPPEIL